MSPKPKSKELLALWGSWKAQRAGTVTSCPSPTLRGPQDSLHVGETHEASRVRSQSPISLALHVHLSWLRGYCLISELGLQPLALTSLGSPLVFRACVCANPFSLEKWKLSSFLSCFSLDLSLPEKGVLSNPPYLLIYLNILKLLFYLGQLRWFFFLVECVFYQN